MTEHAREVMLVGSVPLQPAEKVFETAAAHLGTLLPRIPDGEQIGWLHAAHRSFERNASLEISQTVPLQASGGLPVNIFRLKPGLTAKNLTLGPYGYAANALHSYDAFKRLKDQGKIPSATRYAVTMPGPGTSVYVIQLPADELLPIARAALLREVEEIARSIPHRDLSIQLDIAMEAEHEEYLRRPDAWRAPIHGFFHWTLEQMAESVAWLANRIPEDIELGFHICSIWHHDQGAGQDNEVLVDAANAIIRRVTRKIGYLHIPIIPQHVESDFAPLAKLALKSETKLYLGLINLGDGAEGARRRIAAAETAVSDFGVAMFCGLGRAPSNGPPLPIPPNPALRRATPETIGEVLDLHRKVAEL